MQRANTECQTTYAHLYQLDFEVKNNKGIFISNTYSQHISTYTEERRKGKSRIMYIIDKSKPN